MSTQLLDPPAQADEAMPRKPSKRRRGRNLVIASLVIAVAAGSLAAFEYAKVGSLDKSLQEQRAQVSQLRNDVAAATVELGTVAGGGGDLGSRLDDLETKIDDVDTKISDVDSRADCLDRELDDVETMGQYYSHGRC